MFERTLAAVAGLITLAALIFVAIIAAAYALFSGLEPALGPAGAAAIVAGAAGLLAGLAIAIVALSNNGRPKDRDGDGIPDLGLIERLVDMAKDRPLLSIGALIAAGVIAFRNPAMVATILAAFIDPPKHKN